MKSVQMIKLRIDTTMMYFCKLLLKILIVWINFYVLLLAG